MALLPFGHSLIYLKDREVISYLRPLILTSLPTDRQSKEGSHEILRHYVPQDEPPEQKNSPGAHLFGYFFHTAHVRLQNLGDKDIPFFCLVIFQDRHNTAG